MNNVLFKQGFSRLNSYILKQNIKKGEMIPLVSDTMFHTMLNNEKRKKYVSYMLSLILEKDFDEINNTIKFVKNKLGKENYHDSKKTVDLVCELDGEILNIEMNNCSSISMLERNIDYIMDLYKSGMLIGNDYNYQKVLQININNFTFEGNDKVIEEYYLMNKDGIILTEKVKILYIYLLNIRKRLYNGSELTELEKLLLIFNEEDSSYIEELIGDSEIMKEYRKDAKEASSRKEIIGLYDKEKMMERIREMEKREFYQNGVEEGEKAGIIKTAKNMLNKNISIEDISVCTGLTVEEIENLN